MEDNFFYYYLYDLFLYMKKINEYLSTKVNIQKVYPDFDFPEVNSNEEVLKYLISQRFEAVKITEKTSMDYEPLCKMIHEKSSRVVVYELQYNGKIHWIRFYDPRVATPNNDAMFFININNNYLLVKEKFIHDSLGIHIEDKLFVGFNKFKEEIDKYFNRKK